MHSNQFARIIKNYCKENKTSYKELAEEFGVSASTVYKWARGIVYPKRKNLNAITKKLCGNPKNKFFDFLNDYNLFTDFFSFDSLNKQYQKALSFDRLNALQYLHIAGASAYGELIKKNIVCEYSIPKPECAVIVISQKIPYQIEFKADDFILVSLYNELQSNKEFVTMSDNFFKQVIKYLT